MVKPITSKVRSLVRRLLYVVVSGCFSGVDAMDVFGMGGCARVLPLEGIYVHQTRNSGRPIDMRSSYDRETEGF